MRKSLCIGILNETKELERRAPLTPRDVRWLVKKGIKVEVESGPARIFKDAEYERNGARIVKRFREASLLVGIKPPKIEDLYRDKVYMIFSHTMKGKSQSRPLLKAFLKNRLTVVDYEDIRDLHGRRLAYFGRFAGICGAIDTLHYFGRKLRYQGTDNPFLSIEPAHKYPSLKAAKKAVAELGMEIRSKELDKHLCPFIVGIIGHGNVSKGVQEILNLLNPIEVHPKDMLRFVKRQRIFRNKIYKIVFLREEKLRAKNGKGFYFEEYLEHPERFESNMDMYLQYLNILINTSYWDKSYPRLVRYDMIHKLAKKRPFRLGFIGDISCDTNGSIELTYKATKIDDPVFTYEPEKRIFTDGCDTGGITVLAVDNLPSEMPKDASAEFSLLIRDYVYQIAAHGVKDVSLHAAIPAEIRRAVIAQDGRLTKNFTYLSKFID